MQSSPSSARTKDYEPLQLVQIYFDTATFDRIDRDVKNTLETQISVIGGTMGLLTGYSHVFSNVMIDYYARILNP